MGACLHCGQPAGFMRYQHTECRDKHEQGRSKIPGLLSVALDGNKAVEQLQATVDEIARTHFISNADQRKLIISGIGQLIDKVLADHILTDAEASRIDELCHAFTLTGDDLGGAGRRLIQAHVLRDLDQGRIPDRISLIGSLSVNLARDEQLIWLFNDVTYLKTRTRTTYVGGSQGVSLRVAKGVYYRIGAMKGERVQTPHLTEEGCGTFLLTTGALYFSSTTTALKLPYRKILSLQRYGDGIQIIRDRANARPEAFLMSEDDAWFSANVIARQSQV